MSALVEAKGLELAYREGRQLRPVVGPVDLKIFEGESLGLIGESGAGKSTLALELMGLLRWKGGVRLAGEVISALRSDEIAYIPQDPLAALDPLFSIGSQVRELTQNASEIEEALGKVHLSLDTTSLRSYPHELSGGMRQRLLIAMALLRKPRLIVADEPTSSVDVILQGQVMNLFREIQATGIAFLFVTHNLPLANSFCGRVVVMRRGKFVEEGRPSEIFACPRHSYTQTLVKAVRGVSR